MRRIYDSRCGFEIHTNGVKACTQRPGQYSRHACVCACKYNIWKYWKIEYQGQRRSRTFSMPTEQRWQKSVSIQQDAMQLYRQQKIWLVGHELFFSIRKRMYNEIANNCEDSYRSETEFEDLRCSRQPWTIHPNEFSFNTNASMGILSIEKHFRNTIAIFSRKNISRHRVFVATRCWTKCVERSKVIIYFLSFELRMIRLKINAKKIKVFSPRATQNTIRIEQLPLIVPGSLLWRL